MGWSAKLARPMLVAGLLAGAAVLPSRAAAAVTVVDQYYGGLNTYSSADVIGDPSVFDIHSASFERVSGGNVLRVTIDTNYAGKPGTAAADGTGYGALFITPGQDSWHPAGSGPHYSSDVYTPGEWTYAFTLPQDPSSASGAGGLYLTSGGAVVMANVHGDPITYPNPGNPGYYFRQGQAVQFTPGAAGALAGGSWSVGPGKIVIDIADNHLLGDNFSFSWAMTCGNDVIQGLVSGVPEPTTWVEMILGFAGLGALMRRARRLAPNRAA